MARETPDRRNLNIPADFQAITNTTGRLDNMISEGLIIAYLVCIGLSLLGYWKKSLPVIFISSIGYLICGLQTFQQINEILPMLLLLMLAVAQFIFVKKEAA